MKTNMAEKSIIVIITAKKRWQTTGGSLPVSCNRPRSYLCLSHKQWNMGNEVSPVFYDGITNLQWWLLSPERVRRHTGGSDRFVVFERVCFLTLNVCGVNSWNQLAVSENNSQSFHFTTDPWLLQSAVSSMAWLNLPCLYIIVKLQTYCIFSSYVLSYVFFSINDQYELC